MSNQMSEVSLVKINQWGMMIKAANESPLGRADWCKANGVSESAFYYWQRKVRKYALNAMLSVQDASAEKSANDNSPDFFEITLTGQNNLPINHNNPTVHTQVSEPLSSHARDAGSGITIRSERFEVMVENGFSKETLAAVLEVMNHV